MGGAPVRVEQYLGGLVGQAEPSVARVELVDGVLPGPPDLGRCRVLLDVEDVVPAGCHESPREVAGGVDGLSGVGVVGASSIWPGSGSVSPTFWSMSVSQAPSILRSWSW